MNTDRKALAMVLTGGGARGAYQVGILRCLARRFPEAEFPLLTGVSAGAINAAFLASSSTSITDTVDRLTSLWEGLSPERVFRVDSWSLLRNAIRWALRLSSLIPETSHGRLRPVHLTILRPSVDLGRLAANFEPQLPRAFRFLTRGLGTHQLRSPDFLSLLMFQPDYLTSLIEIGEKDAEASLGDLEALMTA